MATKLPVGRGAFIVIEGLDRSGKSTQVKRLEAELSKQGRKVKTIRFPDRTTVIGQMINRYLQSESDLEDHVIHLLFSANRWELAKSIERDVAQGWSLICDRYTYSGMIYSAAKRNPKLSLRWAREPDVGLPRPDLVIFLDLEPEEAEKRGGYGEEKYEKRQMQENVRKIFLDLSRSGEEEAEDLKVLDASGTIEGVAVAIMNAVQERLTSIEKGIVGEEVRKIEKWRDER